VDLGAKHTLGDLGVPEEKLPLILDASPLIRNRLTLMRMRRMLPL
jgi:glycerol-1-phosphate dehydrogenase [NAD(P)+]